MKVLKWLDEHTEEVILVIFSAIMVAVIFLQVIMRYVFDNSLSWSEELARYCFIWLVYIGISYGVKKQRHIKVDVVLLLLKERGRLIFMILSNLLFLFFCLFVIRYGYGIAMQILDWGQKSPANQIPMGIVYLAAPIGMGLTAIRLIQNLIKQFKALFGYGELDLKTTQEKLQEE